MITLTDHLLGVALVLFNGSKVESWPGDIRQAVKAAVVEATAAQRRFAEEDDENCARAMIDAGVALVRLNPEERAELAGTARFEVERTRRRLNDDLVALFDDDIAGANP